MSQNCLDIWLFIRDAKSKTTWTSSRCLILLDCTCRSIIFIYACVMCFIRRSPRERKCTSCIYHARKRKEKKRQVVYKTNTYVTRGRWWNWKLYLDVFRVKLESWSKSLGPIIWDRFTVKKIEARNIAQHVKR
jgi:hypothetical protein